MLDSQGSSLLCVNTSPVALRIPRNCAGPVAHDALAQVRRTHVPLGELPVATQPMHCQLFWLRDVPKTWQDVLVPLCILLSSRSELPPCLRLHLAPLRFAAPGSAASAQCSAAKGEAPDPGVLYAGKVQISLVEYHEANPHRSIEEFACGNRDRTGRREKSCAMRGMLSPQRNAQRCRCHSTLPVCDPASLHGISRTGLKLVLRTVSSSSVTALPTAKESLTFHLRNLRMRSLVSEQAWRCTSARPRNKGSPFNRGDKLRICVSGIMRRVLFGNKTYCELLRAQRTSMTSSWPSSPMRNWFRCQSNSAIGLIILQEPSHCLLTKL